MKRLSVLFSVILAAFFSYAAEPSLHIAVESYIAAYEGTRPVNIPKPDDDKFELLEDDTAIPPGVLPYPRQLIIDKQKRRLFVATPHGDIVKAYPVCSSLYRGQKRKADDCKTPEGKFEIIGIYNSTDWTYKDTGQKAYGPYFVHLNTHPFYGIGVHGTNAPHSIPGRSSHGCVRMQNEAISEVWRMLAKDSRVTILSDSVQDLIDSDGHHIEHGYAPPLHPRKF